MSGELHLLRQCKREIGLNLNEKDNVLIFLNFFSFVYLFQYKSFYFMLQYGESALHYTCRLGFADMMIYLLNHGANILDIDTVKFLLLYSFIHSFIFVNILLFIFLLNFQWGFTPLHIACENNKSELIKTLIRAGTDINIQSEVCILLCSKLLIYLILSSLLHLIYLI